MSRSKSSSRRAGSRTRLWTQPTAARLTPRVTLEVRDAGIDPREARADQVVGRGLREEGLHRELGAALAQLGNTADSARAFETALALRPQGSDAQDVQMRLAFVRLQTGEKDKALPLLVGLAESNTPVPEVWTALGRIYYEGEKLTDSEKAFRRSAELRDDGRTWFNLAVVRLRLYDKPGAIQALERAARHPEVQTQAAAELRKLRSTDPAAPASAPAGPLPAPGATAPVRP